MNQDPLSDRVRREAEHGRAILAADESNWGWSTPAGRIRKQRRADFLTQGFSGLPSRPKVLEVGCGSGTFTADISQAFDDLVSIDVSDVLLEAARAKCPKVRFEKADIHRTGFADGSFDLVVGCSVLHHLDWDLALREIMRLLRPGGQIRFSEPNLLNPQIFVQKKWPWLKRRLGDSPDESAFTPGQIRASLERSGFQDIVAEPFEFLHPQIPASLIDGVIRAEAWLQSTPLRSIAGSIKILARKPA
ncbi:MAG: class I SAM-dependent methyltransferase [Elusimicrobiota bacterium]